MNDLSELIKECTPLSEAKAPKYDALAKSRELHDLGFDHLAREMRDKVLLMEKLQCVKNEGYPVVTPAKIHAFLKRKADEYNWEMSKKRGSSSLSTDALRDAVELLRSQSVMRMSNAITSSWQFSGSEGTRVSQWDSAEATQTPYIALTSDFLSNSKDRVAGFMWDEVPVRDYKAMPPQHALDALKAAKEKEIFHYFTIASVTKMKDPLLLGRLNGTEDRYFLAQWGDDIALDDVI